MIVYANDTSGNVGKSNRVYFTVQLKPETCQTEGGRCISGSGGCITYCKRLGKFGGCELADPNLGYYPGCSLGNCCCFCG